MGMTRNQLNLVRYVAENNMKKAKDAALCCCVEDTTQKNHYAVTKYQILLRSGGMNLMELPASVSGFATMEDLTNTYLENRYYLTNEEKELFELIKNMNDVSLLIAATNLIEDIDTAVKRRFTEKHELHRLSSEDNERFICQYLNDTGFPYDLRSVKKYAEENHSQAEIMTHVARSIANMLIEGDEMVSL